ncbi:MAG: glycosyltransferase 87 family protein [Candidatus Limnocylindria bacterium]
MPPRANNRPAVLAALVLGLFWCVEGIDVDAPQLDRVVLLLTGLGLAWAALRDSPLAAVGTATYAVLVAASERLHREPLRDGSDVLRATTESLDVVFAGGNPYTHMLQSTAPVGSPFVYPPGELAWYAGPYLLFGDITRVDTWAGIAIVAAIAVAGLRLGMAGVALPAMLYASWGIAGYRAIDGQNDVSASLLVVLALVALAFAERDGRWSRGAFVLSAVCFGWAIAFKQFAVLVLPPVLRYLAVKGADWRRYLLLVAGVVVAFVLPFFVRDPGAFIEKQIAALTFHDEIWGANILNTLSQYGDATMLVPMFIALSLAATLGLVALVVRWHVPTLGAAALAGAGIVMVPLLLARWTTQPYYVYVGAIAACGIALLATRIRFE